jgi:molecular chaperone GrpE (heat shock protein)
MFVPVNEYIYKSVTDTDELWKVLKSCELHANGNVPLTHIETDGNVVRFTEPMTCEQTMHTIESHLKALQADYDRLVTRNKVLEKKVQTLESRLNTEMETSARFACQLTTAKELLKILNGNDNS